MKRIKNAAHLLSITLFISPFLYNFGSAFFLGYLRAKITSGTRLWFSTAYFCLLVKSARVLSLYALDIMCCLQPQCKKVRTTTDLLYTK